MPAFVVEVRRAVAVGMADGPRAGLAVLEPPLAAGLFAGHAPLHAAHAGLLERAGDDAAAAAAWLRGARARATAHSARSWRAGPRGLRHPDRVRVLAETTVDADAPPEAVWEVWADVAGRPRWHPGLAWARAEGPLAVGSRLSWKPERARPVALVVAELVPGRRLVLVGTHGPPVARGHYLHEVVPGPGGGSRLTHRMALSGPLAAPIAALFGRPLGVFGTPVAARAAAGVAAAR